MVTPTVSIVFPILNGASYTLHYLKSIQSLNYPLDKLEVIIFDNGSSDNSEKIIKKNYPNIGKASLKVSIIRSKKNLGFAKAVNLALQRARGEYFFITNNDVLLGKNSISDLVSYLWQNPEVGIVGPKIYNLNRPKEILGRPLFYHFAIGAFTQGKATEESKEVDWVQGCGLCIAKSLWQTLHGFDEGFFFIGEELDLCLRAKHLGFKVVYFPKATIWHAGGATINNPNLQYFRYYQGYKSKFRLIIKHGSLFEVISALFFQLFLFTPYRSLILREKSFIPLVKALYWNIKNITKTLSARQKIDYA